MVNIKYDFTNFMNIRAATSPSFSHDGKHIFFLTNITGVPQVWKISVNGGWPSQITYYDDRVTRVHCSPKEELLTFSVDPGGSEREQIFILSPESGIVTPLAIETDVIHDLGPWSYDGKSICYGSNSRHRAFFDIYIADLKRATTRKVFENDGSNSPESWSHDGKKLLIKRMNSNLDADLYLMNLATGDVKCLTTHSGEASYNGAVFSKKDDSILCLTNRNREFVALVSIDLETGKERTIAKEKWDIERLAVSCNGKKAAYTVNVDGYSKLKIRNLSEGKVENVTGLPKGVIGDTRWSPNGRYLAFTLSGARFNADIWLYDTVKKEALQLTKSNRGGIPQETFAEPRLIHFKTFDNLNIPAFLFTPKSWEGKKPPVVMQVHGGPENQSKSDFNTVTQYLVNQGFAVLVPNVRGSLCYGKTYLHLDDLYKRMDSVKDLKYAHEWLVKSDKIDPKRIAIYGGSYGGFMVLSSLTTYPDLWAAGIDLYGIANFTTFLQNTGPWRRKQRAAEYGDPEKDKALLEEISPIHKADKIVAPLLVVHGINDPRVPKSETDQIVEALKKRGIAVEYVLFNDEGHGIVKLKNRITAYGAIARFLQKHLAAKN